MSSPAGFSSARSAWLALGLVLVSASACRRGASDESLPAELAARVTRLCDGRAGCSVRGREPLVELGVLLELSSARAENGEPCPGSEYWGVRGESELLLASTCSQPGARTRVSLEGGEVLIDHEETRPGEQCSGSSVRLRQSDFRFLEEKRYRGTGKVDQCSHRAERAIDWKSSKHTARWSSAACATRAANTAHYGNAIPAYDLGGAAPANARLGTCAAAVDGAARLRAAVLGSTLLVELHGVSKGALTVTVANGSPDDGALGAVGCGSDAEYRLSAATIDLESRQVTKSGSAPPALELSVQYDAVSYLRAEGLANVKRLALTWRGPNGERVETAHLSADPTAAELPPLDSWFQSKEPCALRDNRLDLREAPTRPRLRSADW